MNAPLPALNARLPRHLHRLLLALGSALVLLLLGSSAWQATASLKALDDLRRQAERVEHLDSMLIQLIDAENAVRGFLLSGSRDHLEPYEKNLATADETLAAIRQDLGPTPANEASLRELSSLVAAKLSTLDQAVERGTAGDDARAKGRRSTDRIRELLLGFKAAVAAEGEDSFERSQLHVERTRLVVGSLAVGALTLTAILFIALERQFQLREQLAGMLTSENQRLDALVQERTADLSDLASYLTNAREAEKARLARELHDELGALLTAAKMEANQVAGCLPGEARAACQERLSRLAELLDRVIALKRRIIDGLRPPFLEELGLVSTLRALGEDFAKDGGETVALELPADDLEVAPEAALALYRIAQEALTNARRHAHAKRVTLALRSAAGRLELEVADDGIGFRAGTGRGRQHGLAGMKHRVQMCAGDFRLFSQPGGGTRIVASIPSSSMAVHEGIA